MRCSLSLILCMTTLALASSAWASPQADALVPLYDIKSLEVELTEDFGDGSSAYFFSAYRELRPITDSKSAMVFNQEYCHIMAPHSEPRPLDADGQPKSRVIRAGTKLEVLAMTLQGWADDRLLEAYSEILGSRVVRVHAPTAPVNVENLIESFDKSVEKDLSILAAVETKMKNEAAEASYFNKGIYVSEASFLAGLQTRIREQKEEIAQLRVHRELSRQQGTLQILFSISLKRADSREPLTVACYFPGEAMRTVGELQSLLPSALRIHNVQRQDRPRIRELKNPKK